MADSFHISNPKDSKSYLLVEFQDEEGVWKNHAKVAPGDQFQIVKRVIRVTTIQKPVTLEVDSEGNWTSSRGKIPKLKRLTAS